MTERLFKVCVVGDIGAGKSTFCKKMTQDIFITHYKSTIGVDFSLKVIREEDPLMRIKLWDISGQERYGNMTRIYYQETDAAFVLLDAARDSTLEGAKRWKLDLDNKVSWDNYPEGTKTCILLVCKSDMVTIDNKFYDNFCADNGFHSWLPISNKTGEGIQEACNQMVTILKISKPKDNINTKLKKNIVEQQNNQENKDDRIQFFDLLQSIFKLTTENIDNSVNIVRLKKYFCKLYFEEHYLADDVYVHKQFIGNIHKMLVNESFDDNYKCTKIQSAILDYGYDIRLKPF